MGITLAQMAAGSIVGPPAAEKRGAVRDVIAAFTLLAETIIFKLQHGGESKGVVGTGNVDILGPNTGVAP